MHSLKVLLTCTLLTKLKDKPLTFNKLWLSLFQQFYLNNLLLCQKRKLLDNTALKYQRLLIFLRLIKCLKSLITNCLYLAITATAMAANNVHENEGVGGNGYMGFYMDWWQNKC